MWSVRRFRLIGACNLCVTVLGMDQLVEAQAAVSAQQATLTRATSDRDRLIVAEYDRGTPAARIAEVLGLTRQHVHRIVNRDDEYEGEFDVEVTPAEAEELWG